MFFFSKSFTATAVLALSLALEASAHALVTPALGVQGAGARANVQRPSTANPCGNVNIASTLGSSTAVAATGDTFSATITNFNAGVDGAVEGGGKSWSEKNAEMVRGINGAIDGAAHSAREGYNDKAGR